MTFPHQVKIVEVGPRDGLQNEPITVATPDKIEFINRLSQTGLSVIEATSFVSPKWIPQLSDATAVMEGIHREPSIRYPVLVPNETGFENALAAGATEMAVFTTPSEAFSMKNTHCSVSDSLERIASVMQLAKEHNIPIRGYISCVLGCPYEGVISPEKVAQVANALIEMGCYEISLGDTIGVGTPVKTERLLNKLLLTIPVEKMGVHFHDTYGQALVNIYTALTYGIATVDSAVAGLGGCPYAAGASGNVATEDVVFMLHGMGIETHVDLDKLISVGRFITKLLNKQPQSKVNLAQA